MTLRLKIVLALVALAAAATAAIGFSSYTSTRSELNQSIDRSLDEAARRVPDMSDLDDVGVEVPPSAQAGRRRGFEQVLLQALDSSGTIVVQPRSGPLPVDQVDVRIAAGGAPGQSIRRDVRIEGEPYRMLTVTFGQGALQLARSTQEIEHALDTIRERTLVAVLIVIVVAALLGWLIGLQVTRRLQRLTAAAGTVASTGRLDVDVPVGGADEAGQLGRAFSGMLGALARSRQEQHQLVQDAGHELRTPLTSLRTNVSVLRRYDSLAPEARQQLIGDLDSETRELTSLVNELVELATDSRDDEPMQPVVLGEVAERAAARVRRRTGRDVLLQHDGAVLTIRPNAVERAVLNLVDNAAKFAADGPVEVAVRGGTVEVRDHGPGLHDADIPHVFDRFFRAVEARSQPGSGLGLAIVKSVVDGHGGTVFARNAPDGGAVIGFTLPTHR